MELKEQLLKLYAEADIKCSKTIGCRNCIAYNEKETDCVIHLYVDHLIKSGVTIREWVSVTEKLPEESGKYLVCTNRGNVYQTKFYSYPQEIGGHWGQKDKGKSITHWMPLPEPPERSDAE